MIQAQDIEKRLEITKTLKRLSASRSVVSFTMTPKKSEKMVDPLGLEPRTTPL